MSSSFVSTPFEAITPGEEINAENLEKDVEKHGGGRPRNVVWQYFDSKITKHPGHFDAKCKFCGNYWKIGIVKKLQNHLARECEFVEIDTKNKYLYIVARRDGLNDAMDVEATSMGMNNEKDNESSKLSVQKAALIDRLVLKAFIMCGMPFRIIENPYFINVLKNLQPDYDPPSRVRLSTNLLSEESIRVEIRINNMLEKEKNLTLGMKLFVIIYVI
jgi:hypothetical protein